MINIVITKPKIIVITYIILIMLGIFFSSGTKVNIDNKSYLPDDINSKKAIELIDKEFGIKGTANLLLYDENLTNIIEIKKKLQKVTGVKDVIWLDDFTNTDLPYEFINSNYVEKFYIENNALVTILFDDVNDSKLTHKALGDIEYILDGKNHSISGPAALSKSIVNRTNKEVPIYSIIIAILVIIILLFSTTSWIEPILIFITIGTAIVINMGFNVFKGEVSQTTFSSANILQLAVSMDYMIFLLHRYHEQRNKGEQLKLAIFNSIKLSSSSIIISALTTISGFAALLFMDFKIGGDMGFVLARGVAISLITVITLLPALIILTNKYIEKTMHKEKHFKFDFLFNLAVKGRYIFVGIIFVLGIIFFLAYSNIDYYYSHEKALPTDDNSIIAQNKINNLYKNNNIGTILIPKGNKITEFELVKNLENLNSVNEAVSLYSSAGTEINDILIPEKIKNNFVSDNYSLINISLNVEKESKEGFKAVEDIRKITKESYSEYYIAGEAFTYYDLREVTNKDFARVSIISVIFIFIVLLIGMKSIVIPIVAILNIQAAIWINVGISYFLDIQLSFISFIIIGAIQLGATVDYAILYINRYREYLENMSPVEAAISALKSSGKSIFTSALILIVSTLCIYFVATVTTAAELCLLIGRGAIISLIIVFMVVPGFLIILNKFIKPKTANNKTH